MSIRCLIVTCLGLYGLAAPIAMAEEAALDELGSSAQLEQFESRLKEAARRVAPAVIMLRFRENPTVSGGSGVVIDESGLVLTSGHHGHKVLDELDVVFADGKVVPAKLVSIFSGVRGDWSFVKIQTPGKYPAARMRDGPVPRPNDWCFHLGYPGLASRWSPFPLLRLGRILAVGHSNVYANCLIVSGDSGGPLFDLEGQVLGVAQGGGITADSHSGWTRIPESMDGRMILTPPDDRGESVKLGLRGRNRTVFIDKNREISTRGFDRVVEAARQATVEVWVDDRRAALGVVVDSDGTILTKRAEILTHGGVLVGKLSCRTQSGERHAARVVAQSHASDVALLRIDRKDLPVIPWSEAGVPERGALVAAVVTTGEALAAGTISAERAFDVPPTPGYVGVSVKDAQGGVRVTSDDEANQVISLARGQNRIRKDDLITHVDGRPILDAERFLKATLGDQFIGGDLMQLTIVRDGRSRNIIFHLNPGVTLPSPYVTLNDPEGQITSKDPDKPFPDDYMPYRISPRRDGFPAVIGHDAVLASEDCGGPLVDIHGRVVGVNIARCRLCQTFALPHTVAKQLVVELLASAKEKP